MKSSKKGPGSSFLTSPQGDADTGDLWATQETHVLGSAVPLQLCLTTSEPLVHETVRSPDTTPAQHPQGILLPAAPLPQPLTRLDHP